VKWRDFITLLMGAAAAWPLAARAQQHPIPVIGFLHVGSAGALSHLVAGFRQGLKETGYVEGTNVMVEFRWAEGQYDRLPALVADLVRREVAVIVTGGGDAPAGATKAATSSIPIVFNVGRDPAKAGLVARLNRPGGNATGVNIFSAELETKRLGLLNEVAPGGSVIAALINPNFPPSADNAGELQVAAPRIGRQIALLTASNRSEIDAAFAMLSGKGIGAMIVGGDPFFNSERELLVALAARYAIPTIYEQREFATAGGLMSYGTNITDSYREMGIYTGRILHGAKPADLPVLQLSRFELVLNLKTAKALGLTFPPGLFAIADEVIE
jgi:putative tryptophan/tyrosine transport system substrate-binding protein